MYTIEEIKKACSFIEMREADIKHLINRLESIWPSTKPVIRLNDLRRNKNLVKHGSYQGHTTERN